jgi:hypothetical protein
MTGKARKIIYGILIAMGCLAAIVVAFVISFFVWVGRPGELIEPERLMSADSTGYAEWSLRLEDPGTEGFLRLLLQATRDIPSSATNDLPPFVDGWLRDRRETDALGDVSGLLPAVAAWTLHPSSGDGPSDLHLLSVSSEGLGNQLVLADWIAGFAVARMPNASVHPYQGENIYQLTIRERGYQGTFFARSGAIFSTSDLDTARQAVDLLAREEATQDRPATDLERLFATTRGADPLRAAVSNTNGELPRVWAKLGGQAIASVDEWRGIAGATVTGSLQADGAFRGVADLSTANGSQRSVDAAVFAEALRERLAELSLEADVQAVALDDRIRIQVDVPDLVHALAERMRARRDQPWPSREPVDPNIVN